MSHTVSITLNVDDPKLLRRAAYERAERDGVTTRQYAEMRNRHPTGGSACDLIMLFDPGSSPPGCSIQDSYASEDAL